MNKQQLEQQYDTIKQQIKEKLDTIKSHLSSIEECKYQIDQLGIELSNIQTLYGQLSIKEDADEKEK